MTLVEKILAETATELDCARSRRDTERALSAAWLASQQELAIMEARLVEPESVVKSNVLVFRGRK